MLAARTTAVPTGAQAHLALITAATGHHRGAKRASATPGHRVERLHLMAGQMLPVLGEQGGTPLLDEFREMYGAHQPALPRPARTAAVSRSTRPLMAVSCCNADVSVMRT